MDGRGVLEARVTTARTTARSLVAVNCMLEISTVYNEQGVVALAINEVLVRCGRFYIHGLTKPSSFQYHSRHER